MFLLTFVSTQSGELYNHDLTVLNKALCGEVRKDVGTKLWSHFCKAGWVNLSEKLQHFKKKQVQPIIEHYLVTATDKMMFLCVGITGIDQNEETF